MSAITVNIEICRALGLDPKTTSRVEIVIEPGQLPRMLVQRRVTAADVDKLATVVEQLRLKPSTDPA